MRVQLQPAMLLHRRPYRESSLLLELFTADYGRIGAVGRGAKSRAGLLQPFQRLLVSWSGRGELASLGAVEHDHQRRLPKLGGVALTCGLYVNELLSRMVARNDAHPGLFVAYVECLKQLSDGGDIDWLLRGFELRLLSELGYGLRLDVNVESGQAIAANQLYCYQPEHGPITAAGGQTPWHVRGSTLAALKTNKPPADRAGRQEARRLMQVVIEHQLGGQTLKTRELLKPVWKQSR